MATPTLRSWYGLAFSTSTTQTSIGMGAPTGTDYPQVGDYIVAFYGSDNLSATTPTATFSISGAGAVGAWSYAPAVSAPVGTAAGSTIGTLAYAQVTTAFTSASRVNAAFASGAAIKTIVASAVNGANVASVAFLTGSNASPATLGAANATDLNVVGTVTESNAAPGVTAGTQIAAVGSTGGGAAANAWSSLVYNSGAAVTTTFSDGMALGVKFVGTSVPSFSGSLTLSGTGSFSASGSAPSVTASKSLSGTGTLGLAASGVTTAGSSAPTGSGSLSLSGAPSASGSLSTSGTGSLSLSGTGSQPETHSGSLALSGSGSLSLSGSAPTSSTYRMYEAATPPSASAADFQGVSVGVEFTVTQDCSLTEIRWWQASSGAQIDNRTGALYAVGNTTPLATTSPTAPSGSGWQTLTLASPVALTAGTRYKAVVYHPGGGYSATSHYFDASTADETNGPLTFYSNAHSTEGQGTYNYAGTVTYTASSFNATNYWTDVTVATAGSSPETHSGSLALAGTGSLGLSGKPGASGAFTPSGTGALGISGSPKISGTLGLLGSGSLSLSGSASADGMGSLTLGGSGSLALGGKPAITGALSTSGSGSLTLGGKPAAKGGLGLGGSGSLALGGKPAAKGGLGLGGSGSLALGGSPAVPGALGLGGSGSLALKGTNSLRNFEARVVLADRVARAALAEQALPSVGPRRRTLTLKEQTS